MKKAVLVFLIVAFAPAVASASEIKFDDGYPKSDVVGKIFGSGSFTLDANYTLQTIYLLVSPVGGGTGYSQMAIIPNGTTTWSAAVPGLISGNKYNVQAQMNANKGVMLQTTFTAVVVVTVK